MGIGSSIREYNEKDFDWAIGVNDVWRIVKSNDLVVLNRPNEFPIDRLKTINESKPHYFYSQIVIWDRRPDFRKIEFYPGYPDRVCSVDRNKPYYKSYCSPFVAAQVAWRDYSACEIHLFGVDLINHPHLNNQLCAKIKIHFRNLNIALQEQGCKLIVHGKGILTDVLQSA